MKHRCIWITAAALWTWAAWTQEPLTLDVKGSLHSDTASFFHEYVVEMTSVAVHQTWRADVLSDGSFTLRDIPPGDYLLKVMTWQGAAMAEQFVTVREHAPSLEVALPREQPTAPGGRTSVRELRHPPTPKALRAAAEARKFSEAGQGERAIEAWRKTIRLSPDFAPAHSSLAVEYIRRQDYDAARREIADALAIAGPNAVDLCNLAFVATAQGRYAEAIDTAKAALKADPSSPHAHYILGTLLMLDQRTAAEGLRHLEKAAPTIAGAREALERWRARGRALP